MYTLIYFIARAVPSLFGSSKRAPLQSERRTGMRAAGKIEMKRELISKKPVN